MQNFYNQHPDTIQVEHSYWIREQLQFLVYYSSQSHYLDTQQSKDMADS